MEIEILNDRCIGCGKCVANCLGGVLAIENDSTHRYAIIENKESCIGCKRCIRVCPKHAIKVKRRDNFTPAGTPMPALQKRIFLCSVFILGAIVAVCFFLSR